MPVRLVNSAFISREPSVPLAMYYPQLYTFMVTLLSAPGAALAGNGKSGAEPVAPTARILSIDFPFLRHSASHLLFGLSALVLQVADIDHNQ